MFSKILLAYDGSPEYRSGLREGAELAQFVSAEVYLLAILGPSKGVPLPDGIDPSALFTQKKRAPKRYLMKASTACESAVLRRKGASDTTIPSTKWPLPRARSAPT